MCAVTGAVTRGCCGVNLLKGKDRGRNGIPARSRARSLRCGGRQGSPLRFDECARERRALDRHPRCGWLAAMNFRLIPGLQILSL